MCPIYCPRIFAEDECSYRLGFIETTRLYVPIEIVSPLLVHNAHKHDFYSIAPNKMHKNGLHHKATVKPFITYNEAFPTVFSLLDSAVCFESTARKLRDKQSYRTQFNLYSCIWFIWLGGIESIQLGHG